MNIESRIRRELALQRLEYVRRLSAHVPRRVKLIIAHRVLATTKDPIVQQQAREIIANC